MFSAKQLSDSCKKHNICVKMLVCVFTYNYGCYQTIP